MIFVSFVSVLLLAIYLLTCFFDAVLATILVSSLLISSQKSVNFFFAFFAF